MEGSQKEEIKEWSRLVAGVGGKKGGSGPECASVSTSGSGVVDAIVVVAVVVVCG